MAAQKKQLINLLPQEEFAGSTMGRVLRWLLSTFRVIVIATEIVVMVAFLSRFYLDARISDLNQKIKTKSSVIETSGYFENSFRNSQKKLLIAKALIGSQPNIASNLKVVSNFLPQDTTLTSYALLPEGASVKALTPSELSITQFIANLGAVNRFSNFEVSQITTSDTGGFLNFALNFDIGNQGKGQ